MKKKILSLLLCVLVFVSTMPISAFAEENDDIYTITYHLYGGTNAAKNPEVYTAADTIELKEATKVGYDFVGWFLDKNMTEQIAEISNTTGNIELYAKFAAKSYIGVFDDNGATSSSPICVKLYNSFGLKKEVSLNNGDVFDPYSYWTPSYSGYVFLGWYYYNYNYLVSGPLEISQDLSLEARWGKCEQTNNDGILGVNLNSITVRPNVNNDERSDSAYVYVPAGITTVRYEGESRYRKVSSGGQIIADFSGNFIIYDATNRRTLVDGSDGGYGKKSGELTVAPGTLLRITATSGYYPGGASGYNAIAECSLTVGERRRSSIIVLNQRPIEQKFDSTINTPNVKKTGYDFSGWYDIDGNKIPKTWRYTENQTFTAKWTPIKYNISYNLDGGTNHASNPAKYTIEDNIDLKAPTKPGYTFKSWYADADFKTQVSSISKKTGNITLYAKWEVNSYNLTLDANAGVFSPKVTFVSDGTEIKSCYLYSQDTITAYRPDGKDGYIFAGWYMDDMFTSLFEFDATIRNDITLYAKWVECESNIINVESVENINSAIQGKTENLYAFVPLVDGKITVTSESNNLDLYGTLYDASKNVLTSADDISDTDLDFTYTCSVNAGQLYYIAVKGNTAPARGQAVINIGWTGNCTVTGTTYQNRQLTVVYDTNYELPQKPVREGYVFIGWFDENDTQITDGTWNFASDKTLTAKWEEATYHTVVFKDIDGNVISSETYYLSEDIVAPDIPTKAPDNTYIYHAKWDNDYTGVCTGDAVYSPVFDSEYIEYTVVFVDEDGTVLSRRAYHWGDVVTAPAAPTKAIDANYANTYTFAGWDNSVVNCAGDATYTATYTAVPLKQIVVTSLPEKVRYRTGESIDLTGLALQLVYDNGFSTSLVNVDTQFVSADLSTSGKKNANITIAGVSAEFEIYVHDVKYSVINVDSSLYPQSSHNYSNNMDETKTFIYQGAKSLVITFNSQTSVENNFDYIYIYDGSGKQIAKYTGITAANKTLTIAGDTFKVRLTSDYSSVKYGYAFSLIKADMGGVDEIIHRPVTDSATVTCTQGGLTEGSHCEICGDVLVAQEEVAALGHQHKTVFTWSDDHNSCTVTITCERDCDLYESVDCVVTHSEPHQAQTVHTAVAEFDGARFTDVLTCDNFLVVFKDWDGTQISSTYYRAGDTVIVPANPTRAADKTYTYTFKGWNKAVVNCVSDATYTATYNSTYIDYTVTFKNWNGDVLSTKTYHYGDRVTAPNNPTKEADKTYTYTFAGWDKTVVNCAGDATYTATYTPNYIDYTVIFKNYNGVVLSTETYHYGDEVVAPRPTKPSNNTYTYTFAGWDKPVVNCAGNATYTATYTPNYIDYTVIFKNYDGTVLSNKTYHYGENVQQPATPIRANDMYGTYTFNGWDSNVTVCKENKIYIATYLTNYTDYTITFKNWNNSVISSKTYHYGDTVTAPTTPTKPADNIYTYSFAGWDSNITVCNGNKVYTATYTPNYIDYIVTFKNYDGTVLSSKNYHYGDTVIEPSVPTKPEDDIYNYVFTGWDSDVVTCNGNKVYTATYKASIKYVIGEIYGEWTVTPSATGIYNISAAGVEKYTIVVYDKNGCEVKLYDAKQGWPLVGGQEYTVRLRFNGEIITNANFALTRITSKLFPDTQANGWYNDAVTYAVGRGILKGYSSGKFGTSDGIQRQDFLVMLARFDGVDLSLYANTHGIFRDVSKNSYFEAAVNWGYEHGIVTGYQDGRFGVGDKITREQIVTFLCRYARYKGIDTSYSSATKQNVSRKYYDYRKVSDFAEDSVLWAIEKGVINGKENNTAIAPQGNAQRCEVAQIMYNIFLKDIF